MTGAGLAAVVPKAPAAADDAANATAELKKLQGTWVEVSVEKAGQKQEPAGGHRIKFDGDTFSVTDHGRPRENGTLKLNPAKKPKEIDIRVQDQNNEERTVLGIYTWDGEHLKLCLGEPGGGTRPTDFTTTPAGGLLLVVKRLDP